MKTIFTTVISFIVLIMLLAPNVAYAQKLPFQGKLLENGEPVNEPRNFEFGIAGTAWTEVHNAVPVTDGLYYVLLGSINPLPVDLFQANDTRSLNVQVNGQSLTPVQIFAAMTSPNYTLELDAAPDGKEARNFNISGIGTAGKFYKALVVSSTMQNGNNQALVGLGTAPDGNTGTTTGVLGSASGGTNTRTGVEGWGFSTTTSTGGTYGVAASAIGQGTGLHVGIIASSAQAPAGRTQNFGALTTANGVGKYNSGIRGLATGAGDGTTGFEAGSYNIGAEGYARDNQWGNIGVYGRAYNNPQTNTGVGVDNIGVLGRSEINNGTTTIINRGMYADARGPGINYGIRATASSGTENWAGWFDGDVKITGNLVYDGEIDVAFPEVITKNVETEGGTVGALTLIAEGNGGGASAGLITSSSAINGSNSGVRSTVTSVSTNTANHYGYLANVTHGGTGQAAGVWANMFGDGEGIKIGVRTAVSGNNSAINYGVRALNSAVTTVGGSNWGGLFTVSGTGVANSTNIGLDGFVTKDNGKNIGIRGRASGGTENWAGWFDGDVKITGNLVYDGDLQVEATLPDTVYAIIDGGQALQTGLTIVADGLGTGENVAFSAVARAESGVNTAIWAKSEGQEGRDEFVYGVYGQTTSSGSGFNTAVQGIGSGTGSGARYGVRGDVSGTGSTFPVAVRGRNSAMPNTGLTIWGANFTAVAPAGIDPTSRSVGVQGEAVSPGGTNIGVFGSAANGVNNWAGWFNGNVKVTGNLSVDGQGGSISATKINQDYGNFGEKTWEDGLQGYLDLRGDAPEDKDNIRVGIDVQRNEAGETFGNLNLFGPVYNDPNCTTCPRNFVHAKANDWGNGVYAGSFELKGTDYINVAMGGKGWEENGGVNRAFVHLYGNSNNVLSNWEINRTEQGQEFGNINFTSTDGITSRFGAYDAALGDPFNGNGVYLGNNGHIGGSFLLLKDNIRIGDNFHEGGGGVWINKAEWTGPDQTAGEVIVRSSLGGAEMSLNPNGLFGTGDVNLNNKAQLRSNWGNDGQGALLLKDANSTDRVTMTVNDYFDDNLSQQVYVGNMELGNSRGSARVGVDGNGYLNLFNDAGIRTLYFDAHDQRIEAASGKVSLFRDSNGDGEINLGSVSNTTGIRMYGQFDGAGTAHIAVDGLDGNHVHIYGHGGINATGSMNAVSFNQTSDARLKTNILPLNNALTNIMRMRGVSYNWIDASKSDKLQIGVIAQEVEEVYPEFVHTNDEGMKSVNYSQMVAVLIEAIKELNTKVETLETANAKLTATVATMQSENTVLKASLSDVDSLKQQMKTLQSLVAKLVNNESVTTSTTTSEQR